MPAELIEQAVFTSAQTERAPGYQLISNSPGLSEGDVRELALWGPSHDSLLEGPGERASTNFHALASGAYAVSRTTLSGEEYSGRGGRRVYTQFLVVPPEVLARFANNPFAVVRAAAASGALRVYEEIPERLEAFRLSGRSKAVDSSLVAQLARRPGPGAMATLMQTALASDQLGVASATPAEALFAGLVNLLPVECRVEFSFSTGLKFSPTRPFRLSALPADPANWRVIGRHGVTLLNLDGALSADEPSWDGWPGCAARILQSGRISLLAAELERPQPGLTCANLATYADGMQAMLDPAALEVEAAHHEEQSTVADAGATAIRQRADSAHARFELAAATLAGDAGRSSVEALVETLAAQPPEVLELLERIDDLVFAAIGGDGRALAELEILWPTVVADLDHHLVEQSREQYLRCALSIWSECVDGQNQRPERAVSAIDVLCVLFEE